MPDQRKSLTPAQREALLLARRVRAQRPQSVFTLDQALGEILDAFAGELGDDEEPAPRHRAAYHAPWEATQPGECYGCHGHGGHDGSWHEAVAS